MLAHAMQQYQLADIYTNLRRAVARGQEAETARWLGEVLGVELQEERPAMDPRVTLEPMLTYRGFKPAELAMLAADCKPVVKFEDLPIADAARFVARHRDHYQLETTAPYRKDYLLLRSRPVQPGMPPHDQLVALYASRTDAGARLRLLESTRREDVAGAGELLGFPPCCVAAFAQDFETSRRDQDTLNDDATRRLLTSAGRQDEGWHTGEAALNPLSDLELLGFYPCRLDCPRALAQARRNVLALLQSRPQLEVPVRERLARAVLFWRLPFFAALEGQFEGDALILTRVLVNAFADSQVRRIQGFFAAQLSGWLAGGDRIAVTSEGVEVRAGDRFLRRFPADPLLPPLAVRWKPWPQKFFDPGHGDAQPIPRVT
jgi:hypothetical protein